MNRRHLFAAAIALLAPAAAYAQATKGPIRVVVPFAAGGALDAVARHVAPRLAQELGQPVIVENKPGASGQLGTSFVKAAPPDGTTYLFAPDHSVVVVPLITPTAGYDGLKDFVSAGLVARFQWVFAVPQGSPATTLAEFIDVVRKDPTQGNYGTPLQGGVPEIIGTAISRKSGEKMQPVPFSGSAQLMPQLIGGQLASAVVGEPEGLQMLKSGKVRLLAISGGVRSTLLPAVPTFEELGFPGAHIDTFNAFFAPKGTPLAVIEKFNGALRAVLREPELRQRIADMSLQLAATDLDQAAAELQKSYRFWNHAANASR